jgi:AP2 domain
MKKWTPREVNLLKKYYGVFGPKITAQRINRSYGSVCWKGIKLGLGNITRPLNRQNLSCFWNIKSPFIAYILGFLWADGYIKSTGNVTRLHISSKDEPDIKNIIYKTSKTWKIFNFIGKGKKSKGKKYTVFTISHFRLKQFLLKNDYHIKSGTSADKILSKIPEHLKHYWWRGYFDGDGCFHFGKIDHKAVIMISSVYTQDWRFVKKTFKKLHIDYCLIHRTTKAGKCSIIAITNELSISRFCDYIYRGKSLGLLRKRNKFLQFKRFKKKKMNQKTSKYHGVFWVKKNKDWMTQLWSKGKVYRKHFSNEKRAAKEYDEIALRILGCKAMLNFPSK